MGSNAPGQLLGFSIQFPRALWHLLRCEAEDNVCLEVFGDVGVVKENGLKLSEEDKSSQNGNPVSDRSIDLWKTFFNWANFVVNGELDIEKAVFLLYVNKKGRKAIIDTFHSASDPIAAQKSIMAAWEKLKNIDDKHEIFSYVEFLKNNEETFAKIIARFEFQVGSSTASDEVKKAIRAKHVSDSQVDYIHHSLTGWLHNVVTTRLAEKKAAIISWVEFDAYAKSIFERAWRRELIDFTLQYPLDQSEIKKQKLQRPPYIQQLEVIKSEDEEIQQAVTDFLKAKANRQKWIEQELIDEDAAQEFEEKLLAYWKTQKKTVNLTYASYCDEDKGQIIYNQCIARQQPIKNQDPPPATIAGTYHLMSNSLAIGWHPKWNDTFNAKSEPHE